MDSLLANAETVVARARTGDPEALGALYRSFEVPVYNLARRICRTTEDAEDVLQETSSRSAAASGAIAKKARCGVGSAPSPPARR